MAKILLAIDIQKEFKDNNGMYEKVVDYCEVNRGNYDIIFPTYFCNNYDKNANFVDKLDWNGCNHTTNRSLVIHPKNLDVSNCECKYGYASKDILKIADKEKDIIDIVGCDSDACVLATAFRLWDEGYNFRILTNYIYTTAKKYTNKDIIRVFRRNFGKCVI